MKAWLWSLYPKWLSFHRWQQWNTNCAWIQGTSAKRNLSGAIGYISHIPTQGEEKREIAINPEFKAQRWVVELTLSWFYGFRELTFSYVKNRMFLPGPDWVSGSQDHFK